MPYNYSVFFVKSFRKAYAENSAAALFGGMGKKPHHEYMELHSNLFRITATMDKYQIISPHISTFRKVLSLKITELGNHFVTLIFVLAYILLPEKGKSNPLHIPNEETINKVKDKVLQFNDTSWDIAYYLDDILTEAQNTLLGDFFSHNLPVRKPDNTDELVLTSTNQRMIDMAKKLIITKQFSGLE